MDVEDVTDSPKENVVHNCLSDDKKLLKRILRRTINKDDIRMKKDDETMRKTTPEEVLTMLSFYGQWIIPCVLEWRSAGETSLCGSTYWSVPIYGLGPHGQWFALQEQAALTHKRNLSKSYDTNTKKAMFSNTEINTCYIHFALLNTFGFLHQEAEEFE
ncbi:hypothetical protein Tco_0356725 [Tanacetum coccineum]